MLCEKRYEAKRDIQRLSTLTLHENIIRMAVVENLGRLKVIAFDKTGTITSDTFGVTDVAPLNGTFPDELLQVASGVERQSNHPRAASDRYSCRGR